MTNTTNPSPPAAHRNTSSFPGPTHHTLHDLPPVPAQVAPGTPDGPVAGFAPPSPVRTGSVPSTWCPPPAGVQPPAVSGRAPRRGVWLLAGAAAVAVSTMAVVAIGHVGGENVAVAVSAADTADTADTGDTADTAEDAFDDTGAPAGAPTNSQPTQPAQPAQPSEPSEPVVEPTTSVPAVVLPTGTAAPATTNAPAPVVVTHPLASVQTGDCLLDAEVISCHRGVDLVTHVATSDRDCFDGETIVTVTQTAATPEQVIVCVVPYALDDRTLPQAFTIDESCGTAAAADLLTFEIDGLVCTSSSGTDYLLVKVAEGQMVTYLSDVLAAEFVGDFTADDGQVCGGHYRIDGWDAYVFGYGPFIEFRQFGDTDGIRFSRSLCAA